MKELYEEMLERKLFLDGVQQTQQTIGRLKELNLVIVRLQQLLICAVGKRSEQLSDLDGKIVSVKFSVKKGIPKIDLD